MLPVVDTEPEAVAAAVERRLWGEPTLTARHVAEQAGVPLDFLQESFRALGVSAVEPDEVAFDERDLESARSIRAFLDAGVPAGSLLAVSRVLGIGMARYAEAVRDMWVDAFVGDDDEPDEAAMRLASMAERFLPAGAEQLDYVFGLHLRDILRHDVAGLAGRAPQGGRIVQVAVGFADIVGFSELGEQLPGDELGAIADRLASRAHDIAAAPVRLVKTIGDAVMLAAPEPGPLLQALLELVEPEEGAPAVRAGLAYGDALHRMGDYYGHTVNVASRVAQRARPGSVLATEEVRAALPEGVEWTSAGPKRLKGVGTLTLHRARPPK
jgi:adenylate cyclase